MAEEEKKQSLGDRILSNAYLFANHTLDEILEALSHQIKEEQCTAEEAWAYSMQAIVDMVSSGTLSMEQNMSAYGAALIRLHLYSTLEAPRGEQ